MSDMKRLINMLDRLQAKYIIGTDGEGGKILTIPAVQKECLIIGFDKRGNADWLDADDDWEECAEALKHKGRV